MRRIARYVAVGLTLVLIAAGTAVGIYTHTDGFRELIREKLVAAVNDSVRGKIRIARIEGSVWGDLALIDVRLFYDDAEIARIARLRINHSLVPLLWKRVQVFQLSASHPVLHLREESAGTWNIVEAFAPAVAEPEKPPAQPSPWVVSVNSLELQNGDIGVVTAQRTSYRASSLNLAGSLGLGRSGLSFDAARISSRVAIDNMPEVGLQGGLAYRVPTNSPPSLEARDLAIETGSSKIAVTGKITNVQTLDSDARLVIHQLTPADAARFMPQWPLRAPIAGNVSIHGPAAAMDGNFTLAAAGGNIAGTFHGEFAAERPNYRSAMRIAAIDVYKLLGRDQLAGVISGQLSAGGTGFDLKDITAEMDARVASTGVAGWNLGNVIVRAKLADRAAALTGEIQGELGHAQWTGRVTLEEAPRYEIQLAADGLDIKKIAPQGKAATGILNLRAVVNGSGISPPHMKLRADVELLPSKIAGVAIDRGKLVAAVAGERIRISQATIEAGDALLNAGGDMGMNLKQNGQLNYRAQIGTLTPWMELAGLTGAGSVSVNGTATGNLADVKTQGTMSARSLQLSGTSIASGTVKYNLTYGNREPNFRGSADFALADVRRGYHLQTLGGSLNILPELPYSFDVKLRARDDQSRNHFAAGLVRYRPGNVEAQLTELTLNLPDGAWRLAQPATVRQNQNDFLIGRLAMHNNDRRLLLDGRFSLSGSQALHLSISRLPVESLRSFYPAQIDISGLLSAEAQLSGTAAAPQLKAALNVENGAIAGQRYAGLSGTATYSGNRAEMQVTLTQDQKRELVANGTLPLEVSWQDGWRAQSSGSIDGRVRSDGLSIAFLSAFSGKGVQDIGGEVALDVRLRGTLDRLMPNGFVRLRDGKLTPRSLGIQITGVTMEAQVEPSGIRIQRLTARSGDGQLDGSGTIGLNGFVPREIGISLDAKNWPAINTQEYRALTQGSVTVSGTVNAPRLTGKIEVLNGELHPNLAFIEHGTTPVHRDPTITVVSARNGGAPSPARQEKTEDSGENAMLKNVAANVQIHIPNNLWIRHRSANVELSGNLQVSKMAGTKPVVSGVIDTVRGWVGFQGRRFTLTHGRIELTGGDKINPMLDIAAEYRVTNYLVHVTITGAAAKPTLALTSDPQLDQADILSLLLFNKPISALGKGEQLSLQQNAIDITTGFAASAVGSAVSKALGLQDLGDVDFSGGQLRYGRYISRNTFVSVGQDITGKNGQEASAEYQITPDWKLSVTTTSKGERGVDLIWHKRY